MNSTQIVARILNWDWPLHVGVNPLGQMEGQSPESSLICSEAITINGLVLTPSEYKSEQIQFTVYPLARELIFGGQADLGVGWMTISAGQNRELGLSVSLILPADKLQNALLCLSSKWRSLYIWVADGADRKLVTDFGFSEDLDPSQQA